MQRLYHYNNIIFPDHVFWRGLHLSVYRRRCRRRRRRRCRRRLRETRFYGRYGELCSCKRPFVAETFAKHRLRTVTLYELILFINIFNIIIII